MRFIPGPRLWKSDMVICKDHFSAFVFFSPITQLLLPIKGGNCDWSNRVAIDSEMARYSSGFLAFLIWTVLNELSKPKSSNNPFRIYFECQSKRIRFCCHGETKRHVTIYIINFNGEFFFLHPYQLNSIGLGPSSINWLIPSRYDIISW
jgi:hypothetical protein